MGTRSLTYIKDEFHTDENVICMYRQYDGYPSGHGLDLAAFLNNFRVVNGLSIDMPKKVANGMSCLAAQLVAELKDGPGNIYLYPPNSKDCGEEFIYEIYIDKALTAVNVDNIIIKCIDVWNGNKLIFEGSPQEFLYEYGEELVNDEFENEI
tara:strand:+ start:119 stop:574 length:456 start_codon:yes stop_codon:yes gene_type:complete